MRTKGTMETTARIPAEVFSPGEFLKEELESRGWSQVELSEILDRPPRLISEIISGKRAITPETAKGLAAALNTSAELWMNLETSYRLSKTPLETSHVQRRARLYGKFPVKELLRRGWVKEAPEFGTLEANFCSYFSIRSIDEAPTFKHAAKKQQYNDVVETLQLAWLIRAEHVTKDIDVPAYSASALRVAIRELQRHLSTVDGVRKVPEILAHAGVRFVIVEYLPRAKLDGACFWINKGKSPVIAMSLRLDRVDNFWHTLFHEIDHILHEEGRDAPIIDILEPDTAKSPALPPEERRANEAAANYCIPQMELSQWLSSSSRPSSKRSILAFAHSKHVHPALVVGQLQHGGVIPYSFHRDLLEKVRSIVIESAVTDGYRAS